MLPILSSKRLILRPFQLSDAAKVQELAGNKAVAEMTAHVPYPYLDGMAEEWILKHKDWFTNQQAVALAIESIDLGELIGAISITDIHAATGALGYWIGQPYWGKGYCTEAVNTLIGYAFDTFSLDIIYARHLISNPASGKVMTNNGFTYIKQSTIGDRLLKHYQLSKMQSHT